MREMLTSAWGHIQGFLFPMLRDEVGPLTPCHERLVTVLDVVCVEAFVQTWRGLPGRPAADRFALARAFAAKAVLGLPTTLALLDRLAADNVLRRLCGFESRSQLPSESTFSRAFAEFAAASLPERIHQALIKKTHKNRLAGHISRDSTAIEARERPVKAPKAPPVPRKRGRPRKDEPPRKKDSRLQRQGAMTLAEMLADLPKTCGVGAKRNAHGHNVYWTGYKLHIDTADGDIPISCLLTSASVHDSQAAIPLASMTAGRVTSLYDVMDSAYDAPEIRTMCRALGHVPIINAKPCRGCKATAAAEAKARTIAGYELAETIRYRERTASERVNSALKDSYGGRGVRVRGHAKVFCHLMFGILALTAERLMQLVA